MRLALAVLLLAGCAGEPKGERVVAHRLGLELHTAHRPSSEYWVSSADGGLHLDFAGPMARSPKTVSIVPSSTCRLPEDKGRIRRGRGLRWVVFDAGGGSGGVRSELHACLTLEDRTLQITCTKQYEHGPDARDCLATIETLRSVPTADSPLEVGPRGHTRPGAGP